MKKDDKHFEVSVWRLKAGITNFTERDVEHYRTVKGITGDVLVQFADGKAEFYDAR